LKPSVYSNYVWVEVHYACGGLCSFCLSPEGIGICDKKEPKKTPPDFIGTGCHRIQPDGGKQLCGSFVHGGEEHLFPDVVPG